MKSRFLAFNTILGGLVVWLSVPGCASMNVENGMKPAASNEEKPEKQYTAMRLHLEVNPDSAGKSIPVPVFRDNPTLVNIEQDPFLDERSVTNAVVVDVLDSFAILVQFDYHGTLALDNITSSYRGGRYAIQAEFNQLRWLAAPVIDRRISDGTIVFTPDATREEANRIVRGLNNVAVKIGNTPKPKKPS